MTQSPRERVAQRRQLQKQQSQIFEELLGVLDDLDRACDHWQEAQQASSIGPHSPKQIPWWLKLWHSLIGEKLGAAQLRAAPQTELGTIINSAYDGVSLIRQSLLDVLQRQEVTPIEVLGQPFDPTQMHAMGQESSSAPANTVIKEVLKGYLWQGRVLRDARVIVAAATDKESSHPS
ncbi:MAG: nucleotide exchange factor GrpE [Cyanobacteria bacterium P01_H01_bin.26]